MDPLGSQTVLVFRVAPNQRPRIVNMRINLSRKGYVIGGRQVARFTMPIRTSGVNAFQIPTCFPATG